MIQSGSVTLSHLDVCAVLEAVSSRAGINFTVGENALRDDSDGRWAWLASSRHSGVSHWAS